VDTGLSPACTQGEQADDAKSASSPWRHIDEETLARYYELHATSSADAAAVLSTTLGLGSYRADTLQSVRVSMAMQVLNLAQSLHLPRCKAGVLLNVWHAVLQTLLDGHSADEALQGV